MIIQNYLSGRIRLNSVKENGHRTRLKNWFHNLILNTGLEQIALNNTYLDCCHVGFDDTIALPDQTTLLDFAGATSVRTAANSVTTTEAPYKSISSISYLFDPGAVSGVIRELGFGSSVSPGSDLFNRALVQDENGVPSYSIVPNNESLEVEYELTVSAPTNDIRGTLLYNGEEIWYTARPAFVTSTGHWCLYRSGNFASIGQAVRGQFLAASPASHVLAFDTAIGTEDSGPIGVGVPATYTFSIPYTPGSYRSLIRAEWDMYDANFEDGIRSLLWFMRPPTGSGGNSIGAYQLEFDEPIQRGGRNSFMIELGIQWNRLDVT